MDVSDTTKQVMEMIKYEEGMTTKFFILRKSDGKQYVSHIPEKL
jgi:hypothetical protein